MNFAEADALLEAIRSISIRHRVLAATRLAPLGLYPGQEVILLELAASGPRTQAQLALASGCEAPTITHSVRKLEAAGLVSREICVTDARAVMVELSEQGGALIPELKKAWRRLAQDTVSGLVNVPTAKITADLAELAESIAAAQRSARR